MLCGQQRRRMGQIPHIQGSECFLKTLQMQEADFPFTLAYAKEQGTRHVQEASGQLKKKKSCMNAIALEIIYMFKGFGSIRIF